MQFGNPLLNDDPNLDTQAGLELSGASDPLSGLMRSPLRNGGSSPTTPGLQPFSGDTTDFQNTINSIFARPTTPVPATPAQAQIFYSPSTGDIVVNGSEPFNQRNASMALASEEWARQPARRFTLPDTVSDWREMSREEYNSYLETIKNPGFGRRVSEGWEHAWRGFGDTALGASLAVNPNWEWAQEAHANLTREFEENAPFLMQMRDVQNVGDGLTYVAQMAVQGVPWLVETLVSMGAGALIGGAVSGGVGAPAGAVEGFMANQALRQATRESIRTVLRNNIRRGALAFERAAAERGTTALTRQEVADFAVQNSIASADDVSRFFNFGERAFHLSRGGQMGSIGAMFGSNYAAGVGDIRNSIEAAGGDPESADSVASIWGYALPYALIESAGDLILTNPLTRAFPGLGVGPSRIGNMVRGAGLVGASEGLEEGAQYITTQHAVADATNRPVDIEPVDLLESVVGGAIAGAALGGVGGLFNEKTRPPPPPLPPIYMPDETPTGTHIAGAQIMGGLEPPDIDPNYGNAGEDTRFDITGTPVNMGTTPAQEREALRNTLSDPNTTPEQRDAIIQAMAALEGGADPDMEAADRYRANNPRGVLPELTPLTPYQEPEILDTSYTPEVDPLALDMMTDRPDLPPGLSTTPQQPRSRSASELWQALQNNEQLEPREFQTLREAIQKLAKQNPTNPGYANVLNQLAWIEAEQQNPEEQVDWTNPPLAPVDPNRGIGTYQMPDEPARAKPVDNPIMEDGLPKYGQHRLKRPVDQNGKPVEQIDYIGEAERKAKKQKQDEEAPIRATERMLRDRAERDRRRSFTFGREDQRAYEQDQAEGGPAKRAAERAAKKNKPDAQANDNKEDKIPGLDEAADKINAELDAAEETKKNVKETLTNKEETPERVKEAAKRAKQASETRPEAIPEDTTFKSDTKLSERATKAKAELIKFGNKNNLPLSSLRGKANGLVGHVDKGHRIDKLKHPWMYANGDLLSANELREIVRSLDLDLAASGTGLRSKKVEPDVRAEQASELFHGHLVQEWKNYKNDPGYLPQFKEFVLDNKLAATSWVDSKVAQMLPPAVKLVREILTDSGSQKASLRPPTTVTAILREVLTTTPDFTFKSIHPATRERSKEVVKRINDAQRAAGEKISSLDDLAMSLSQLKSRLREERNTQKASEDYTKYTGPLIRVSEAKSIIKRVQANIAEQGKFRTTHVFKDIEDFYARAHEEMMEAPNGAKVSFASYIMREVEIAKRENEKLRAMPDGKIVRFIVEYNFVARGVTVPYYDALVVFADHFKTGSKREFIEVLEHEYIVHKGLRALFRDNEERWTFLHRALQIPGMERKIDELVARYPGYRHSSVIEQVEEVLAFHAMEGPLALETLLSAKEGMHQETRHTLWQDFKQLVKDWLARVFGDNRDSIDKALDDIVADLRQYAITGNTGNNPTATLFKYIKHTLDYYNDDDSGTLKAAMNITTATPAETHEVLYDTANDPGRPYAPTNWGQDLANTIRSNQDLMEKLKEVGNDNVITPIKEGLKKVGRELVTMNQMALESKLMEKVLTIMDNTIKFARYTMSNSMAARPHADKSAVTAPIRALWGDKAPGSTEEQRTAYNRMAIIASNNKLSQLSDSIVREAPRLLVRHPNGTYTINYDVYEALVKRGTFSKEEFLVGIEQFTVDSNGDVTSAGVAKLSEKEIEAGYDIYVIETREMAKSALITLEAMTTMLSRKNDHLVQDVLRANEFKPTDEAFAYEAIQRMFKLYADIAFYKYNEKDRGQRNAQKEKARDVIIELMRTFHEKKKVADWTDLRTTADKTATGPRKETAFKWREQTNPHEDVKPFVNQIRWFLEYDATFGDSRLARISGLGVGENRQFQMLGIFQNLINSETLAQEKENDVIQSILGNYVEMTRKGDWRVSIDVYEEDGKTRAEISPELLAVLPVIYAESKREANTIQENLAKELSGTYTVRNVDGDTVKVKFDVAVAMAPGTKTMSDAPKIKEFLQVSELVGLKLTKPDQMKQIANLIENASTRKRFGLQRAGAPGMDANILRNNDETISRRAWEAAKTAEAWMLESTLSDKKNIEGDWDHLAKLQRDFDIANQGAPDGMPIPAAFVRNPQAVLVAEIALLRYANQLRHMAKHSLKRPTVDIRTTKGEQKLKIVPEGQSHLEHALALKESLERNQLELNLNDLISKTGPLRQMAVVSQLGTIASGIMNAFTPFTHLPSILMARHRETGYGGAFGLSEVIAEIGSAASQVITVFHSYAEVARLKELLDEAKAGNNRTPLTIPELEAMYMETLNGKLTPQQTYSLTGGTESNISNLLLRNASRVLLKPFSAFEAATRRVAFLASYRLYKARYIAAGLATEEQLNDVTSDEYKKLIADVEWVIDHSQGNYNNINRPRSFRGDIAQYITQYKMFPLVTVLMINNLPLAQKGAVLGTLFLLAGMKGEPFADDFMDIYDTVMQKLGLQHDSLELSMTQFFEELLPGSSKWIMHGAIDSAAFGGTMSSRIAMGDIIPLTGVLRPEADIGREILNAFGPAYAANSSAVEYAGTVTDFALEVFGMRPRTTDWIDLFRKFPQGQVRGLTEAGMMLESGQIVDPQGRLTSDEVTIYNIFTRALGFYPLEASNANNAVRLDRMHTGYMKAVRARFILAYANAYRRGDDERMESISDSVRDWNEAAELTGQDDMIIRNFRSAAVRAGRAASSTSIQRTSDGAPDYSLIDELAVVLNADTETDE